MHGLFLIERDDGSISFHEKQTGAEVLSLDRAMTERLRHVLSGGCPCSKGFRFDGNKRAWLMDGVK
jgi:hypothetical protein